MILPGARTAGDSVLPVDDRAVEPATWDVPTFLQVVAHDLRAPVASVRTMLSVLSAGHLGDLQPAQADVVARIEQRLESLQALVDDLIDLASLRAGGDTRRSADLAAALRQVLARLAVDAQALGVSVAVEAPGGTVQVAMAPSHLDLVLHHLLGNAIKYGGGGTVRVSVDLIEDHVRMVVADSGIGIPDEAKTHLFEPFFRAPGARAVAPGSGLGLVIVKEALERCAGAVGIESVEGSGTTVTVRLPRDTRA